MEDIKTVSFREMKLDQEDIYPPMDATWTNNNRTALYVSFNAYRKKKKIFRGEERIRNKRDLLLESDFEVSKIRHF